MTLSTTAGITTLDDLRTHLQWAIELEHATLPPYLCALYSLEPERNPEAVEVVGSVFAEEMLHLLLAANLLNAVGGAPVLDAPHLLPSYPHPLPHGDGSLRIGLHPFGTTALDQFLRIESPAPPGAPTQPDGYATIGQFYAAIEDGMQSLCRERGERAVFVGDTARQIPGVHIGHAGGRAIAVRDLASALDALGEIVEQGEGAGRTEVWDGDHVVLHPERDEVAHYFRFVELKVGRRFRAGDTPRSGPTGDALVVDLDGVLPMRPNPRTADYPVGSAVREAQDEFNYTYCELLRQLEQALNGSPTRLGSCGWDDVQDPRSGAGTDADAHRRRRHNGWPDIRVRTSRPAELTAARRGAGVRRLRPVTASGRCPTRTGPSRICDTSGGTTTASGDWRWQLRIACPVRGGRIRLLRERSGRA